jgi:hypothetical protein
LSQNTHNLSIRHWWPPHQEAADEFMEYNQEVDEVKSLRQFDKVTDACKDVYVGDKSGNKLYHFFKEKIDSKSPASLVRLGDADGNVLFNAMGHWPELSEYCLKKISQIYFGDQRVMVKHADFFTEIVLDAVKNADVIGAPERGTLSRSFNTPLESLDTRGMLGMRGVYNYFSNDKFWDIANFSDAIWSSTWYSRALLPYYAKLLQDLPFCGFITCYPEMASMFQKAYNIGKTQSINVPMQASVAGKSENIRHYPDAYQSILDSINPPYEGAVYIIAAGILSKPYATMVKARGGIAIDVGSIADVWMGTASRPGMEKSFVDKWTMVKK